MEYKKIINLLDNAPNQPSKFRTKNQVQISAYSRGTYSTDNQIEFKTSMLKSSLCDYNDAYILVRGTITIPNTETVAGPNKRKNIITKNCDPFTDCRTEINNTQIDNSKYIDVVMPIQHQEVYANTMEMNNFQMLMALLLIFLLLITTVLLLNFKKLQAGQATMTQKLFKKWNH